MCRSLSLLRTQRGVCVFVWTPLQVKLMSQLSEHYMRRVRNDHCCPLCERNWQVSPLPTNGESFDASTRPYYGLFSETDVMILCLLLPHNAASAPWFSPPSLQRSIAWLLVDADVQCCSFTGQEADGENAFLVMMEQRIAQSPEWVATAEDEVASAQTAVDSLKALQPLFMQYDELKSSVLPTEEAKVLRLQQEEQAAIELQDVAQANQAEVRALPSSSPLDLNPKPRWT